LRPILMTSFAFIMGVLPMVFSTGAGAEMRSVMGIAVFSGMLGVTFFGLFFTPMFYVLLRKLEGKRTLRKDVGEVSDYNDNPYPSGDLMSPKDFKELHL